MGDLLPFRRKRRPVQDYGRVLSSARWEGKTTRQRRKVRRPLLGRWLAALRPWLFLAILLLIWPTLDAALIEPPEFLSTQPVRVSGNFPRCGPGRHRMCVVDGDTFWLASTKVRLVGIDAPETHPSRCIAEARLGEAASVALERQLSAGPFLLTGRIDRPVDRYGRELRTVTRLRSDGSQESVAEAMLLGGTVRRYAGGLRGGWC